MPTKKNNDKPLIAKNTVIKLTIKAKDAQKAYDQALKKLAKKVKADGFRKGKVPTKIAESLLKPQAIIDEALQQIVPELYTKELKKAGVKPLTYPEFVPISLEKGKDWIIEAHVAQRPSIDLKDYKKIVKKAKKDAEKELEKQVKAAEKHAKECKDEKHKHQHNKPSDLEKKNFVVQYIYRELITTIKPEIQELLVKEETRYDLENLARQLKQLNIPFEKFLEQRKISFEQLSNELAAGALARLQTAFLIDEIAKKAKLTVEKSDLEAEFNKIKDKKLKKQQQSDPRYAEMMSQTILRQKVADHLYSLK